VKLLDHLGLIDIEPGPRLINIFRLSNRWRTVDAVEAVRLAALAREVQPHRRFERRREPKPVQAPKPGNKGKASETNDFSQQRLRVVQRRVPSLPTMAWQDDGR
jgi:hypothetical protein